MSPALNQRPAPREYFEHPAYDTYIAGVPDGDLLATLTAQMKETGAVLGRTSGERAGFRYAPGKWTVREVAGHVADAERVFSYRALRFSRGDATPLPGFDENLWVPHSGADRRPLPELAAELAAVRQATLALLGSLDDEAVGRSGSANGRIITVRALGWIIAGHERHHLRILRDRYGLS